MYMEEKDRGDSDEAQTINMGYEAPPLVTRRSEIHMGHLGVRGAEILSIAVIAFPGA
jgi:hypothetical protein